MKLNSNCDGTMKTDIDTRYVGHESFKRFNLIETFSVLTNVNGDAHFGYFHSRNS